MNGVYIEIHLAAPVARIWEHLTDPIKLAAWLMKCDFTAQVGANFTFTSEPSGTWDGRVHCEIKEVIERERLSFTWNANDIGAETLVTFQLEEVEGGTRLLLTHTCFEDALPGAEGRHAAGWTNVLKALKTTVCGADPEYDWSAFQVSFFVEAPLADVFTIWATPDGLRRFWADEVSCVAHDGTIRTPNEAFRHGDRVGLTFPTGTSTELEILNIEKEKFITFTFGQDYGWVRVLLSEEKERTKIVLRQFGLPTDGEAAWEVHTHARGWWISNLMNLKSVLLHGRDLRVRDAAVSNGLGVFYDPQGGTSSPPHDWSCFDVHLYIEAPPDEVLSRWRSAWGIESFFVGEARFIDSSGNPRTHESTIAAGDLYQWRGIHGIELKGTVLEATADKVAFSFGARYAVEVTTRPHGSGTLLRLRQSGMADDRQDRVDGTLNCRSWWIYFLTALKSQAEGGIDLRDRDAETADAISVGYNR